MKKNEKADLPGTVAERLRAYEAAREEASACPCVDLLCEHEIRALRLGRFVADGLLLVAVSVVHRDVKPPADAATEAVREAVPVTRWPGDKDTMSFDGTTFMTVRACVDCGVLICGGPTRCLYCAAKLSSPAPAPSAPVMTRRAVRK